MNKRMADTPTSRRHRREKATIDHLVDQTYAPPSADNDIKGATTDEGLSIEEQVRKKWGPGNGGLPTF